MSEKVAAAFHGSASGIPVFITKVGVGIPTQVTPEAAEGLEQLGWTAPAED